MTETPEYKVDRTSWPSGPWDGEPDRVQWNTHGFPALIVRNRRGALCGYIAVPVGHPWYESKAPDADVHGGVTYAYKCNSRYVLAPGEPDDIWWLGFDCGHDCDVSPVEAASHGGYFYETYRDIGYVRGQVERLAEQARAAS